MKDKIRWAKAAIMGLLPLLCCLIYCAFQGKGIGDVYLPNSLWNDELFYFKQVEGIVNYGYPQGYFGFNESHALELSFAAWSPILVFPWVIWGLIFGWNLMSPIICNIVLMILCCFFFGWLVKPTWKQLGTWAALFCLYTPFVRYMLSGMPEVICFSLLILFYAFALCYQREEKNYQLVVMLSLSGVLTLMRPYLILFLLLPLYYLIRKYRIKGILGATGIVGVVLVLYWAIKHYLGAEYFTPLFYTDWAEAFLKDGLFEGIRYTFGKLYYMGADFINHTKRGVTQGLASGAFFAGSMMCMGLLGLATILDLVQWFRKRKEGKQEKNGLLAIEMHFTMCFLAMFIALLLMYRLTEGSKHLLTFMAAAVFVLPMLKGKYLIKPAVLGLTFAYFYIHMATSYYDYQVPFAEEQRVESVQKWEQTTADKLVLDKENTPNFENVVIWTFSDVVDGNSTHTQWQVLYALPEGFGISCCMPQYVIDNFDTLQSKYICVAPGGEVEKLCEEAGMEKIVEAENAVLYER